MKGLDERMSNLSQFNAIWKRMGGQTIYFIFYYYIQWQLSVTRSIWFLRHSYHLHDTP